MLYWRCLALFLVLSASSISAKADANSAFCNKALWPKLSSTLADTFRLLAENEMPDHEVSVVLWLKPTKGYDGPKVESLIFGDDEEAAGKLVKAFQKQAKSVLRLIEGKDNMIFPSYSGTYIRTQLNNAELDVVLQDEQIQSAFLSNDIDDAPQASELAMAWGVMDMFFTGEKTVTIRKGRREQFKPGPADLVATDTNVRVAVNIQKVEFKLFKDLTPQDLAGEGPGVTRESLLESMKSFYPDITENSEVTVVTFSN